MLNCTVTRTHHMGEPLNNRGFDAPVPGIVRMQYVFHKGLNRNIAMMTMDSDGAFAASRRQIIPDLLEPQILTFCSDRGMMVCGFEELAAARFYQGWWITWDQKSS